MRAEMDYEQIHKTPVQTKRGTLKNRKFRCTFSSRQLVGSTPLAASVPADPSKDRI